MNATATPSGTLPGPRKLRALKARGLTQRQIAEGVGVGQGTISRYARGDLVPSLSHFVLLRNYLRTLRIPLRPEDFVATDPPSPSTDR